MTKKERLQMERLERLLAAERERCEQVWAHHRTQMYELVDLKMKLEAIQRVINGTE